MTQYTWSTGDASISIGETNLGSICLENVKTDPINILYEWLNKDGKVICSGTIDLPGNSGSGSTGGGSGTIKLISPVGHGGTGDEGSGEEGDLITFKWSAPDIKGPFFLHIVELKESQSPDEAMLKNKAFFEQKNIEGTSFKYPGSAPKFEPGKKYAWMIQCGELRSSISIYDRWGIKIAYSWKTDYHLDNADILGYLRTDNTHPGEDEVIIKKGEYLFDYSTNLNGDVTLPLTKPIRDNRINKAEVMFEGVPADIDCAKDGSSCVGGPRPISMGKPSFYTVKPVIANGFIIGLVLSYKGANGGSSGNQGNSNTNEACKDFGVVLMDYRKIWKGDSAFVEASITNKYRGDDPKNKPMSFGIKIQNGLVVEFADNVIKGWTRTPSKFPPGSSEIKWTNNSGDIPNGETKFGNIRFANAYTGPISVQYEWLNKDDQVLCSGTIDLPGSAEGKKKFAFRWKTNYRLEHPDILKYLKTEEVIIEQGEYPYDYSSNPNGDVVLQLAKPVQDKGIEKKGIMVGADCRDASCLEFGDCCVHPTKAKANCLVKPVIENGLIIKLILSFQGGNSGSGSTGGGSGTIKLISPVGHGGTGDEGSGEEGDLITFKWLAPDIKGPFFLHIVELKESQSPDEAMLKNKAFFEQKNIEGTSFKYPGSAPKFEPGKKYAWIIQCGELQSSISIYDRWGTKIAYSWETDYHLDNADILGYLQTDEVIIKKGKYLFDYSTNPNGDVILPLANPIRDNRLADPEVNPELEVMFEGVPADIDCAKDGSSCVGGPRSTVGKPSYYTVKAGIANGFIFQLILSYKAANSGQNDHSGDPAVGVKINPPAPNQLKLSDLTNFTLTNGILKPLEVVLSCTLTSAKTQPLLIIVIIVFKKFTLPPGPTTFTPDDFKSGDVKFASDEWSKAFGPNGKVPAGDYTLCVSVQDQSGKEIGKSCIEQKIVGDDAPQLISPTYDLPPTSNRPTFEWKMESALENVSYSITVKELEEGKDIENGVMVLERSNIRENTLPFPKNTPSLDAAKSYGWQLSWFKNGRYVGKTPFTRFSYSKDSNSQKKKIELVSPIGSLGGSDGIKDGITFKWTAPDSKGPFSIKIFEINGRQSTEAAMKENKAFFEQNGIEGTTFKYPESAQNFEKGKKYAWRIETNDKALSSSDTGSFTLAACGTIIFTPVLLCAGNNTYNFSLTCQNAADPGTDPNCSVVLTAISLLASSIPVTVTSSLPLTIQPGQISTINGQFGPILPSTILMFSVTFTSPNGSGSYAPAFTLPLPPSTPGTIAGLSNICQGQTGVVYSISTVTDATSYSWTVPAGASITSGLGTPSITVTFGNSAGNVCVSASNLCGSSTASCKTIAVNPPPAQPGTITGSATPCQGSSQNYSVTNVPGVTYTWTFPVGWTPAGGITNTVTKTVGTASGTITVTPSNACGSGPARTFAVTPMHIPATPGVVTGPTNVCQGQSNIIYSIASVSGAISYNWIVPSGATITTGQGTTSITVTFGSIAGNVCVSASNLCGNTPASCKTITFLTAPPAPAASPGTGIQVSQFTANWTAVAGASGYFLDVAGNPGFASFVTGYQNLSVGTSTSYIVTGLVCNKPYFYRVRAVGLCGGISANSNFRRVDTPQGFPSAPGVITGPTNVCQGQPGSVYSISPVSGATSYNWSVPPGATITGQGAASITVTFGILSSSGDLCVKAINSCGESTPSCKAITVRTIPEIKGEITGPASVCAGQTGVVYSNSSLSGTVSYNWTITGAGTISTGQGTTSVTVNFSNSVGSVSLCLTASNICGTSAQKCKSITIITVPPAPVATAATDNFTQTNQFTAHWNAVPGATGYIIEISTNPGFNISSDTRIVGAVTSYIVTGLNSNATCPKYYYRVTAMNSCGTSGVSNVIPVAAFQTPHGSWTPGPGYSSFTISTYGSTANIVGCPGQPISITMEVWGGGGGGEGGAHGGTGSWFLNGQGGNGGGGGAGGGYKKITITAIIPSTGTKTYYVFVGSGGLGDVVNSTNATAGGHSEVNLNASYLFSGAILHTHGGNPGTSYSKGGIGGIDGGQSGGDGERVATCNGGAGGSGGAGGGPGNINHGGNGGHGGYYRHALMPTCKDHDQDYLWSVGENGGNGKVVFTW
ncbi:MAG: hypothetical protein WCW62_11095 [Bacteroidales bacterium]